MSMPGGARLVARNLRELHRQLKRYDSRRRPIAETAVKVELFRLRRVLQGELRRGQVAGKAFTPLRVVSRGTRASRKPLARLAVAVRYSVKKEGDITHMSVGFDGPQSSKSWRRIAHAVQEGGEKDPGQYLFGSTLRKLWARIGGDYKKGRGKGIAKFFFLRKKTSRLQIPARPIVEPFWQAQESQTEKNIISNFNRKMLGERI
ncbi:MAG: hypothetical protein WBB19_17240 [Desulforhopalus sp.]